MRAQDGAADAVRDVIGLAVEHPRHYDLRLQTLTYLPALPAAQHFISSPARGTTVLRSLADLVNGDGSRRVQFGEANLTALWLCRIAAEAAETEAWDLLDESVQCMLTWDGAWDQWKAQDHIADWLRQLSGNAAHIVAAALEAHPSAARHFGRLQQDTRVDNGIRRAIQSASDRGLF